MSALIGQTLASYRITSQIGKGGMATVFKAYQPSLDRYVAVKVLPPYYAEQDETFLKRFQREAKAIASLRHPNILIVMDYGEQDGTTYIVMEYVESGTLTDVMGQPLAPGQMANLVGQVAGALDYAHQAGVVHRDIKPSNILLPKPDWPLLTDFGLAKMIGGSQLTQSGTIAGTPAYMSPEQGRGDSVDARSDIYSLGIVLYEMATGVVPFQAETPMAVVVKHIIDPLPMPSSKNPDLPEAIERVILKALAKEPGDRFQHAGDMAAALSEAVAGLLEAAPSGEAAAGLAVAAPPAEAEAAAPDAPAATLEPTPGTGARDRWPTRRIALAGVGVLLVASVAFGARSAMRRLQAEPALQTTSQEESEAGSPADVEGRTIDQLIADARAEIEAGDPEAGGRNLELALERNPQEVGQLVEISELQRAMGDLSAAVGTVELARALHPEDAWAHEAAGYIYRELGDDRAAAEAFERAIELDPGSLWTYLALAETQLILGEREAASEVTQRALEAGGAEDPDLMESFGWMYLDNGETEQAEAIFALLAERHPGDLRGAYGLAEVRYQLGDVAGAIAALEQAAESSPEPDAYETLAWWHWELGQVVEAQRSFERALELDPRQAFGSYGGLASLLVDQGQPEQAEALLREATLAYPQEPQMHAELGHLLMDLERPNEAVDPYEQAIELDPENGYRYVELARALAAVGEQTEAVRALEEGSQRAAGDPWLYEALGWGYADMARCDLALDYFERALELDPSVEGALDGLRSCGG